MPGSAPDKSWYEQAGDWFGGAGEDAGDWLLGAGKDTGNFLLAGPYDPVGQAQRERNLELVDDGLAFLEDLNRNPGFGYQPLDPTREGSNLANELLGISDLRRAIHASQRGDDASAALHTAMAWPGFKLFKPVKKVAEEGAEAVVKKSADDAAGAGGRGGDDAAGAGRRPADPPPRQLVTTPRGTTFDIPEGYVARPAKNGKGIVYQRPGAPGDAGSIRIMEPTPKYPNGYFRFYNNEGPGQPLDVNGKPGPEGKTHIPEDFAGPVRGWPR